MPNAWAVAIDTLPMIGNQRVTQLFVAVIKDPVEAMVAVSDKTGATADENVRIAGPITDGTISILNLQNGQVCPM